MNRNCEDENVICEFLMYGQPCDPTAMAVGHSPHGGHPAMSVGIFWLSGWWWGLDAHIQLAEDRDTAKHPAVTREAPNDK